MLSKVEIQIGEIELQHYFYFLYFSKRSLYHLQHYVWLQARNPGDVQGRPPSEVVHLQENITLVILANEEKFKHWKQWQKRSKCQYCPSFVPEFQKLHQASRALWCCNCIQIPSLWSSWPQFWLVNVASITWESHREMGFLVGTLPIRHTNILVR